MVIVVVFMFLVAVLLGAVAIVGLAHAHDHARPELNGWFDKLQSNNGICCSGNDGRTVLDADWESRDGHYRVRLENEWYDVHDDAVVKVPNIDGRTVVWPIRYQGRTIIRCFMPGEMS